MTIASVNEFWMLVAALLLRIRTTGRKCATSVSGGWIWRHAFDGGEA